MIAVALALGWSWGGAVPSFPGVELAPLEDRVDGELRTLTFQQTVNGLPIVGAFAGVVLWHGRVVASRDTLIAHPHVVAGSGRVLVPIGDQLVPADAIDDGADTIFVAADGKVVMRTSRLRTVATLAFDVPVRNPLGDRKPFPAAGISVGTETTAPDGSFALDAPAMISVTPTGAINLVSHVGDLQTAMLAAAPETTTVWSLAGDEHGDAQLATYIYATQIEAKDVAIDPAFASYVATPVFFHVNETVPCVAYSTGDDVHFAQGGQGCENTGRLADVVYHEFGHTFHFHTFIRGMGAFDQALSEGLADYNAITLTGDPAIGRGFFLDEAPVRDDARVRRWPEDQDVDPHVTGQIVAGALWDLREAAGPAVAETVFHGLVLRAPDIPHSYTAALIEDDDDGDLSNGTPHGCAITRAFARHGLVPDYAAIEPGPPASDGATLTVPIVRSGTVNPACPPIDIASVTVDWHTATDSGSVALADSGDAWTGTLPDGLLAYTVTFSRADGTTEVRPDNPADPYYQALVADTTTIGCASMDDDPGFTLRGFSYGLLGDTDDGSRNPHAAYTGDNVVGTTRDGFYGANVRVFAETPPIDAHGHVHLQFRRWLTVEDGAFDKATIESGGRVVWRNASGPHHDLNHLDREWRFVDVDLGEQDGPVTVRWALASDDSNQFGGWNLDDVCLVATNSPSEVRGGGGCSAGSPGLGMAIAVAAAGTRSRRRRRSAR